MMRRFLPALLACLALALLVAACGEDDESGGEVNVSTSETGGATTTTPTETSAGGATAPAGATKEVVMKDTAFQPATVTVSKGDTVKWVNDDSFGHDVTADDDSFSSGEPGGMAGGDTYEHTFDEAGSFKYVCTVHPGMEGEVVVK